MNDFAAELYISKSKLEKIIHVTPILNEYVSKKRNLGIKIDLSEEDKISLAISVLLPYVDDLNYLVTARALVQQISDAEIKLDKFNQYINLFNKSITCNGITDKECKILILLILISKYILNYSDDLVCDKVSLYINQDQSIDKIKAVIESDVRDVLKDNNINEIDEQFLNSLLNHIENKTNNHYPNTIEENMELRLKREYSYAYSIATQLFNKICISLNCDTPEYEKNYLTLYIQSLINRGNVSNKMNVLIVCQYGLSVSHYIQTWIERNINLDLNFEISSVLNYWNIKDASKKYDLIVTTIDNLEVDGTNLIKVDTVPLDSQLLQVKNKITNVYFQNQMNSFFSNNTLKQIKINEIDQMYEIISNDFKHANNQFIDAMRKRTEAGLSIVNGVVIMHSDGTLITDNRLLIYKLDEPITYNGEAVKMIFVFAFTTEFIERFNSVIKQIYRVIYSEQYVHALYETKTDKQFMWILCNQIREK
ncbi:PTS sugar transporter subunit IIA [Mollicutes bacterium LVI A0075]|nr:PTS sugar transporter subunit IIA [Mollicutes bacterium LVI A0075]